MNDSAGVHLIVDGYVKDGAIFTKSFLEKLFKDMAIALDMKIIMGPNFIEVPVDPEVLKRVQETGNFEDEGGITGLCVISTSHMSLHAWPLQGFFSLDAFSCKTFDHEKALHLLREAMAVSSDNVTVLHRNKPRRTI